MNMTIFGLELWKKQSRNDGTINLSVVDYRSVHVLSWLCAFHAASPKKRM